MGVMGRIMAAIAGAREGWRVYDNPFSGFTMEDWYDYKWALYDGNAFADITRTTGINRYPAIYRNTRLIYKHVSSVVDFYAMTVYSGDLSTDGQMLPNGTLGAIPIDPQLGKGKTEQEQQLRAVIAEEWSAWNWRQNMTLRPTYGAALGDVLTELIDDLERGFVYPNHEWPGRVKEIELDYVGNVKRYVLEYEVREEVRPGVIDSYTFRKEVDKEAFRYFKDDKPYDFFGPDTAVYPNPYGFVPAIWDRHQVGWGERGIAATESTWQALQQLNSLLSHGKDFQHKKFSAPIFLKGVNARGRNEIHLQEPPTGVDAKVEAAYQEALASSYDFMPVSKDADIAQLEFDIGQTLAMLQFIKDGILEENPEANFFKELRDLSSATGPAIERLQMDGTARCKRARLGYDANSVKLFQMGIAMGGYRANNGDWGRNLTDRQKKFLPYTLDSYKAGQMDFGILDRPVVPMTESERLALIAQRESLQTLEGYIDAGIDEERAKKMLQQKREAAELGAF